MGAGLSASVYLVHVHVNKIYPLPSRGWCCPDEAKILSAVSCNEDLVAFCNSDSGF